MVTDPWKMFRGADFGDNIEEVVETEECKVLRLNDPSGDGLMTIYRVFDGVYLMYNDFHLAHCYSRFTSCANILCIDHCREGRMEHRTEQDLHYYIEAGVMRVDRRVHHTGDVDFPLSHYHGITIGFFMEQAEKAIDEEMPTISVDIASLAQKFCSGDRLYILRQNSAIEHIFSELYHVPSKIRMVILKSMSWSFWCSWARWNLLITVDRPYFYSSQIEKIKSVHKLLTEELSVNYTTEELAKRFDISVGALKTGFKGVYGSPIYTYIRTYKMNVAASVLVTDRKKKIIDVAASVGYDNPSKFAAAFKELFGMSPAEYRNDRR